MWVQRSVGLRKERAEKRDRLKLMGRELEGKTYLLHIIQTTGDWILLSSVYCMVFEVDGKWSLISQYRG